MIKKISALLFVLVLIISSCAFAETKPLKLGVLTKLNSNEQEFSEIMQEAFNNSELSMLSSEHKNGLEVAFFDSLSSMLNALSSGRIDEIALPEKTAVYIIKTNPEYTASCMVRNIAKMNLVMAFRNDDEGKELCGKINRALDILEQSNVLGDYQRKYIDYNENHEPVNFAKFDGAKTIKIAVTGDLPPFDYVAPDGKISGFNAALIAEIATMAKFNVEILNIEAGARTAALTSGRADVVFWYEFSNDFWYGSKTRTNLAWTADVNEGLILSRPFYSWNTFIHLKKK